MADVGEQVASTIFSVMERAVRLLSEFLMMIMRRYHGGADGKSREALSKLDGKSGYMRAHRLQRLANKANENVVAVSAFVPIEDVKRLNDCVGREGVLYTALYDSAAKAKTDGGDGKTYIAIYCREKDRDRVLHGIQRYHAEKTAELQEAEIRAIISKPAGERTEEDVVRLRDLAAERERVQKEGIIDLNEDTSKKMIADLPETKGRYEHSLDQVLDRDTGRYLDKDQTTIVVDARDPYKMIECRGKVANDAPDGKPYVRTEYTVHNGSGSTKTFDDGYHDGKKTRWRQTKNEISATMNGSGSYYKFMNQDEYEKWAKNYMEQNRSELSLMDRPHESRNYDAINSALDNKLKEDGAYVKDGVVYDTATNKTMESIMNDGHASMADRARASEAITVNEQIDACKDIMNSSQEQLFERAAQQISAPGTTEYEEAGAKLAEATEKYESAQKRYDELLSERKDVNSAQAFSEESSQERAYGEQHSDSDRQAYEEQASGGYEREQRGDSPSGTDQYDMEEVVGEIEDRRADDGARGNDFEDRGTKEAAQQAAENIQPPTGGDR